MIDIHCHLLFGVDDGPETIEGSIAMLEEAKEQGITNIILTPHYRRGMFKYDVDSLPDNGNAPHVPIPVYIHDEEVLSSS